ncbi:putative vinorine synthase [Rosa chinensis]|uniref:Putative vinorine synthase n=1 Tax=Rosa chinensis TaxID=74649 RepID=A0A2P6SC52_ROSCH|nr:putative vinorine synthase [Rosa chinensis]
MKVLLSYESTAYFQMTTSQPDPNQLNKLLPCELECVVDFVLAVQANIFDCGGMTIGVCISHKIADALSLVMFLNPWASVSRRDNCNYTAPAFDLATFFPRRSISGFKPGTGIARDKIVTKRFVFSASTVASLLTKYTTSATDRRPTRIEALSAFVWSRFLASMQGKPNSDLVYKVLHACSQPTNQNGPGASRASFRKREPVREGDDVV